MIVISFQTVRKFYRKVRRGGMEKEKAVHQYNRAIEAYEEACKGLILAEVDRSTLVPRFERVEGLGDVRQYSLPN